MLKKARVYVGCFLIILSLLASCAAPSGNVPQQQEPPAQGLQARDATGAGGVVSSAHPVASEIGLEVLKKGGNAVDAAVAVSFALGLLEPNASGIGGCGYLLYSPAGEEPIFIDYRSTAPAALDTASFISLSAAERKDGIMGAGVPGAVAGWLTAHEKYGTMPLADLLEPTIRLSEEGFEVTALLESMITDNYSKLLADEASSALYLDDGLPFTSGSAMKNPDYANTLRLIAQKGTEGFYSGEVAQSIVEAVSAKGGLISLEDLSNYEVIISKPVKTTYRGYTVFSSSHSSSGGAAIAECLNILERYDIGGRGQNSAQALHLMAEAFKLVNADRYEYLGDPDFVDVPLDILLSKEFADERAKLISEASPNKDIKAGEIPRESPSTTHFSVVDSAGNMIAVTNTLGTYFGCGTAVAGRGFLLDNQLNDFAPEAGVANSPEPEKRPRSSMSPTLIFSADGTPYATLGTPGGDAIVTTMVQLIINLIDYDMSVQAAIESPRIYQNYTGALVVEGDIDAAVLAELEKIGHEIEKRNANSSFFGGVQAIVNNGNGTWTGGADPRREGEAAAY